MKVSKFSEHILKRFHNISIKNKILLYNFLIVIITLTTISLLINSASVKAIIEKAKKDSDRELALVVNNIDMLVNNISNYTITLSLNTELQKILKENIKLPKTLYNVDTLETDLSRIANTLVGLNTNITSINIMTRSKQLFDISTYDNAALYPILTDDYLKVVYEKKYPYFSGPYPMKNKTKAIENVFLVSKPVININSGVRLGMAVMYIKEDNFSALYHENIKSNEVSFYILNSDNTIISAFNHEVLYQKLTNILPINEKQMNSLLIKGNIIANINNVQSLINLKSYKNLDWKVISIVPLKNITFEQQIIQRMIIVTGFLCLLFAFIASFFLSRSISKPLLKLVEMMKNTHLDNLESNRITVKSNDEIGILGNGYNNLMDRIKDLMHENDLQQKARREYEFKLIQSQIKPHFLYNTLETIISFIKLSMHSQAICFVQNLATFYRISLSDGNDIISIESEIKLTNSYLFIQKNRYIEYIDFVFEINEEILQYNIPKLTLQPIVENAIYHGLKEKKGKGIISIVGYLLDNYVILEVYDNGKGIPPEIVSEILKEDNNSDTKEDFGLASVIARLKLLHGNDFCIKIESEVNEYTRVILKIKIE